MNANIIFHLAKVKMLRSFHLWIDLPHCLNCHHGFLCLPCPWHQNGAICCISHALRVQTNIPNLAIPFICILEECLPHDALDRHDWNLPLPQHLQRLVQHRQQPNPCEHHQ